MATNGKEERFLESTKSESVTRISSSKQSQKSWRSSRVSSNNLKPDKKPPRKILRLEQNYANLSQRSLLVNKKPKISNIVWDLEINSKSNSNVSVCGVSSACGSDLVSHRDPISSTNLSINNDHTSTPTIRENPIPHGSALNDYSTAKSQLDSCNSIGICSRKISYYDVDTYENTQSDNWSPSGNPTPGSSKLSQLSRCCPSSTYCAKFCLNKASINNQSSNSKLALSSSAFVQNNGVLSKKRQDDVGKRFSRNNALELNKMFKEELEGKEGINCQEILEKESSKNQSDKESDNSMTSSVFLKRKSITFNNDDNNNSISKKCQYHFPHDLMINNSGWNQNVDQNTDKNSFLKNVPNSVESFNFPLRTDNKNNEDIRFCSINQNEGLNSRFGNKLNFQKSDDVVEDIKKTDKNMVNNISSRTEFGNKMRNCKKTWIWEKNTGLSSSFSLDEENIGNPVVRSKSSPLDRNSTQKRNQNVYANFGSLSDVDLEDFVFNLKGFLQSKLISENLLPSKDDYLKDCSDEHFLEFPCVEGNNKVDESNNKLKSLCCHLNKNSNNKMALMNASTINNINVIATVKVIEPCTETGQNIKECFNQKCKDFTESSFKGSNSGFSNIVQRNSNEFKSCKDLILSSCVYDENLKQSFNEIRNNSTKSLQIFQGHFTEAVLPVEKKMDLKKLTLQLNQRSVSMIVDFISDFWKNQFFSFKNQFFFKNTRKLIFFQVNQDGCQSLKWIPKDFDEMLKQMKNKPKTDVFYEFSLNKSENCAIENKGSQFTKNLCLINEPLGPAILEGNLESEHTRNLSLNQPISECILKIDLHKKGTIIIGEKEFIKNVCKENKCLDEKSLCENIFYTENNNSDRFSAGPISSQSNRTESKISVCNKDPQTCRFFPKHNLLKEEQSLLNEGSVIIKNELCPNDFVDFFSSDIVLSLNDNQSCQFSINEDPQLSRCSTPLVPNEDQDPNHENLVKMDLLQDVSNLNFILEMEAHQNNISGKQSPAFESSSLDKKDSFEFIQDVDMNGELVGCGNSSKVCEKKDFHSLLTSFENEKSTFDLQPSACDLTDGQDTETKLNSFDLPSEYEFGSESSICEENYDVDSVLSLYAPSNASFLDENGTGSADNSSLQSLFLEVDEEEERLPGTFAENLTKKESLMNSDLETNVEHLEDDLKQNENFHNQFSSSITEFQASKIPSIEESFERPVEIEEISLPIGFCQTFVKKGHCLKLPDCRFKHECPSRVEILSFSFSEEFKNGKLKEAYDFFVRLKDIGNDSAERTELLMKGCLKQSDTDMAFLLIPDLIQHKMLTPKLVHDIFMICSSCPFKYEEKLWKLYETMMLLNLCPSVNSILILLQMYMEMLNWSKIWQILLNTIHIEPLTVIPTDFCHKVLTSILNDVSYQYLPQAVSWISMTAIDDLWSIEPCLLYHLSILFKNRNYMDAYFILHDHLQQVNAFPEEIIFTEKNNALETNPEYKTCLKNIQEIQKQQNWLQLSDIFLFIYESSELNSSWFIQPIVEAFLKIENSLMMATIFRDFINTTCVQLQNLVKENPSYHISFCRKHLLRMIMDLISFCYHGNNWEAADPILSCLLENELEFDLKDHLDCVPHEPILAALEVFGILKKPSNAISLLEGLSWFCQLPPLQFINNLKLKQWLKRSLKNLMEQLSSPDDLPNGCRIFSLFVSIIQEETNRWHTNENFSPFKGNYFPCINHAELMNVSHKFIVQCFSSGRNVSSAIYVYNLVKPLLYFIDPRYCNVTIFRGLLVAAHLGPKIRPCARELYNFCARRLKAYPCQNLIQPPWIFEMVLQLTDIETHLIIEDYLEGLYNILCEKSLTGQQMTLNDLHLVVIVKCDVAIDLYPKLCCLKNVPMNMFEVLQQILYVLKTYVLPPLDAKMNDNYNGLIVNPDSLENFFLIKDSQRRNVGLQFD